MARFELGLMGFLKINPNGIQIILKILIQTLPRKLNYLISRTLKYRTCITFVVKIVKNERILLIFRHQFIVYHGLPHATGGATNACA
ncbi:MAG: hypothetical protein RL329_4060 [Bacteroidota bacterium]